MNNNYKFRQEILCKNKDIFVQLSLSPSKQVINAASDSSLKAVITYIRKIYGGEIGLSKKAYLSIVKKDAFSILEKYIVEEQGYKDKKTHRTILIECLPILKYLLDPLW